MRMDTGELHVTYTLREIVEIIGGEVIGDDRVIIDGVNSLDGGAPGEISFFADQRYKDRIEKTKASALIVAKVNDRFQGPQVVVANPALAYARVAELFAPAIPRFPGVSDRAACVPLKKRVEGRVITGLEGQHELHVRVLGTVLYSKM